VLVEAAPLQAAGLQAAGSQDLDLLADRLLVDNQFTASAV
jgi:hypothetical protein